MSRTGLQVAFWRPDQKQNSSIRSQNFPYGPLAGHEQMVELNGRGVTWEVQILMSLKSIPLAFQASGNTLSCLVNVRAGTKQDLLQKEA